MLTEQRVEELDLSIIQSIPSIHQKTEKASGNNKALAWTLKKLECLFFFPAAAWGHTEKKKRHTGGWGRAVQWAMQMHVVGVLDMCSRTGKCSATPYHAVSASFSKVYLRIT